MTRAKRQSDRGEPDGIRQCRAHYENVNRYTARVARTLVINRARENRAVGMHYRRKMLPRGLSFSRGARVRPPTFPRTGHDGNGIKMGGHERSKSRASNFVNFESELRENCDPRYKSAGNYKYNERRDSVSGLGRL